MTTYADAWNSLPTSQLLLPSHGYGSVQIILGEDGECDQVVEMMDADVPFDAVVDEQRIVQNVREQRDDMDMLSDEPLSLPSLGSEAAYVPPDGSIIVILDTNVLISHLPLLTSMFNILSKSESSPTCPLFVVPYIVLSELDGLKFSEKSVPLPTSDHQSRGRDQLVKLSILARRANETILELIRHHPTLIRGQRRTESLRFSTRGRMTGDDLILDCCLYFRHTHRRSGFLGLLSDDKNLCLKAEGEGIPSMNGLANWDAAKLLHQIDPNFHIEPKVIHPAHFVEMEMETEMEGPLSSSQPINNQTELPMPPVSLESTPPQQQSHHHVPTEDDDSDSALSLHNRICQFCGPLLAPFIYHVLLEEMSLGMEDRLNSILSRQSISIKWEDWDLSTCVNILEKFWRNVFEMYFASRFEQQLHTKHLKTNTTKSYYLQSTRTSLESLRQAFGDAGRRDCSSWTKGRWKNNMDMLKRAVFGSSLLESKVKTGDGVTSIDRSTIEDYFDLWDMQIERLF